MSLRAALRFTGISSLAFGLTVAAVAIHPAFAASEKPQVAQAPPAWPLIAVVSIGDQHVTIWSGDGQVTRAPVSTGMSGHRTPMGVFAVIGKERYHESNLYSNAPMPFMQRITWSGVALHAGHLPGYPASHGCIRMPEGFAEKLYGLTKTGMRVIVTERDTSPFAFQNAALPTPSFVRLSQVASIVAPSRIPASFVPQAGPVPAQRMQLGGPTDGSDKLLNPMERGKIEQTLFKDAFAEARSDTEALLQVATTRGAEARAAADARRSEEANVAALKAGRDRVAEAMANPAASEDDKTRLELGRLALEGGLAGASQRLAEALDRDRRADEAAFAAVAEAKSAMIERDQLEQSTHQAERATEPVSVFVSRKERKLYIRQGFEPIYEADVEIADPQDPIGTHVFTAVGTNDEGSAMRWLAVSLPDGVQRDEQPKARVSKIALVAPPDRATPALPPTAANALARVKIPADVMQKISEKTWIGASLILSDYRLSDETGKYTDFIVLTRSAGE